MDYMSVREAAEKWGITERRVQQYCKSGVLEGTKLFGRSWGIPVDTRKPEKTGGENVGQTGKCIFMPLTSGAFLPGKCRKYIKSLKKGAEQELAWAEYDYFAGRAEQAAVCTEKYLNNRDVAVKLSANILFGYANLSLGQIHLARFALQNIRETLESQKAGAMDESTKAVCVYAATMGCVLLHLPMDYVPPLSEYIPKLPGGLKVYACYLLSHQAYLEGCYERSLGIAETALCLQEETYPIACIYIRLMAAISAMNLKNTELAKKHFRLAWKMAKPDDLIEAFGEYHGLLQGLIEVCLRKKSPEDYERIIGITYRFSAGWRKIHNPDTNREVADELTTLEFAIAMLADRGWNYQEIADHMGMSVNSVGKYLSDIYQKLGITLKKELHTYMLY